LKEEKCVQNFRGKPDGIDHYEDVSVNGIILIRVIKKWLGRAWTGLIWLRIGIKDGLLSTRH
jgi:hypothetical protein